MNRSSNATFVQSTVQQKIQNNFIADKALSLGAKDLAVDLEATAHPRGTERMYWDGDYFIILGRFNINCTTAFSRLTQNVKESLKLHFIKYCNEATLGITTLTAILHLITAASNTNPPSKFDIEWIDSASDSKSFRQRKALIQKFFLYWKDRFPAAMTDEALNFLMRVSPARQKSNNVESDDPEKSWLTDEEYDAVLGIIWQHYDQTGCTQPTLLRLLAMQYARRPKQLAELKFGDLKQNDDKESKALAESEIHFPSAKEQDAEQGFRTGKFEVHPISQHLWQLLEIQRNQVVALFRSCLDIQLTDEEIAHLPVFTSRQRILNAAKSLKEHLVIDVQSNLKDELFHLRPGCIGKVIRIVENGSSTHIHHRNYGPVPELPISPRTGKTLVVTATRLRHTRARQLARQGVPKRILSHWLGHVSEDSLKSYYSDPAEEARQLDERMSPGLIPIAMAFHGRIITSDAEATRAEDPDSRLEIARDGHLSYVGRCGKFSFCSTTSIPVPCYRCKFFEPLVDAPHEEVLEALIYRQFQEQEVIKRGGMRNLLIPIDLSADIRAVERCIALCEQRRKEAKKS